jgi:hypothetical protein
MVSQQTTRMVNEVSSEATVEDKGVLDGGVFVAGVAIGVAPAIAAAGIMLDSRLMAYGLTAGMVLLGALAAALSTDQ